jgi:POT family proton-dependent oligopeptide transporter
MDFCLESSQISMQLSLTIILSVLSIIGWYSLGWAFGFSFLTVIAALMMMITKS